MLLRFYKYQGTGNDFVMIDNRGASFPKANSKLIAKLCDRKFGIGADGLILIEPSQETDFKMVYFNADGSESTMCGNGGRCIVAFAKHLNLIDTETTFEAVDGLHFARIENDIVHLQMVDVDGVQTFENYYFVDTGSPHHVALVNQVSKIDVVQRGRAIRNGAPYFEEGANVNFVEILSNNVIKIRTYERGVEDETLSCGTGATAAALVSFDAAHVDSNTIQVEVEGGTLTVSFSNSGKTYSDVFLIGAANYVYDGNIEIA